MVPLLTSCNAAGGGGCPSEFNTLSLAPSASGACCLKRANESRQMSLAGADQIGKAEEMATKKKKKEYFKTTTTTNTTAFN